MAMTEKQALSRFDGSPSIMTVAQVNASKIASPVYSGSDGFDADEFDIEDLEAVANDEIELTDQDPFFDKFNETGVARHPAGSSKGGQFAPKGKAGAGGGSGNVKHGYAAKYTQAQKALKAAKADYEAVYADKSASPADKTKAAQNVILANNAKKQALKDYYANKGAKAVKEAEAAKPAGLSVAEREASIAAVKKEKGAALKEYKQHPTGSDAKKAALAQYNEKAALEKKMVEGLEKAKAGGGASNPSGSAAAVKQPTAKPAVSTSTSTPAQNKHNAAMAAVLKAHPHPTFGKKEIEGVVEKGMSGKTLGFNEQKVFDTYQQAINPAYKHPSVSSVSASAVKAKPQGAQIKDFEISSSMSEITASKNVQHAAELYKAAYNNSGYHGAQHQHSTYVHEIAKSFGGNMATNKVAQQNYTDYEGLKAGQKSSIRAYTGSAYGDINNYLRGKSTYVSESTLTHVKNMDAGIATSKAKADFVVMRGLAPKAVNQYIAAGNFEVGKTMIDTGYVSTTSQHHTASGFKGGSEGYHMVIRVKKGQSIAPVNDFSKNSGEGEFIMPRNSAFQILHIDKTAKVVVVDVL